MPLNKLADPLGPLLDKLDLLIDYRVLVLAQIFVFVLEPDPLAPSGDILGNLAIKAIDLLRLLRLWLRLKPIRA